jgi:Icc-related predicted phosphoesterase
MSHWEVKVPDGDILLFAGDIGLEDRDDPRPLEDFNHWLGELPCKDICVIAGNHDYFAEKHPQETKAILTNCHYLQHDYVTINELTIFGSPYSPRFFDWAFNVDRGEPIKRKWDLIPSFANIVITHGPVAGILDVTPRGQHVGCEDLLRRLQTIKPKVHVSGHIHNDGGKFQKVGETTFVNASVCNEDYDPINNIVVLDI